MPKLLAYEHFPRTVCLSRIDYERSDTRKVSTFPFLIALTLAVYQLNLFTIVRHNFSPASISQELYFSVEQTANCQTHGVFLAQLKANMFSNRFNVGSNGHN